MKVPALICLLLAGAAATARSENERLESVQRGIASPNNYENPKYGISVVVRDRPKTAQTGQSWGSSTFDTVEIDGTKISVSTQENNKQIVEIRVPLNAKTIEYLFNAKNEPDCIRRIAASSVRASNLPQAEQLKLLERGTHLPEANLRYHIWYHICDFKPQSDVVALLPLGARDPCIDIAHECLEAIIKAYDLRRADGSEIKVTTMWRGSALAYYTVKHREIFEVAKALHQKKRDLMPKAELEKIRDRAMPSNEWLEKNFANNTVSARDYFQDYARKTMAEQVREPEPGTPDRTGR